MNLRKTLESHADQKYRDFSIKSIPCDYPIIGVRIPQIRKIVSSIPSAEYEEILKETPDSLEEVLARGMIICKLPFNEMIKYFNSQIKYINDWCSCDIFCSGLRKVIKNQKSEFLETKVKPLLNSHREFTTRVGLVISKCSYVEQDYLNLIFEYTEKLANREEYYVKMAIAWLLSECFIKFPSATTSYLISSNLPKWTYNKTISKICDSYRVDDKTKTMLKRMHK